MKLTFLGTRGEIDTRTRRHRMHSALLVSSRRAHVMIDCGTDWTGQVRALNPTAILITHAHLDHVGGLKRGVSCPVFATAESWSLMHRWRISKQVVIEPGKLIEVGGIRFEAFPVEHSIRAPAVGYHIASGRALAFYAPDILSIHDRHGALAGIQVYIGDGASITRPILRKSNDVLIGHASIRMQLEWCRDEGVRRAIFSHCGTQIASAEERMVDEKVTALGKEAGVEARVAFDGLQLVLGS